MLPEDWPSVVPAASRTLRARLATRGPMRIGSQPPPPPSPPAAQAAPAQEALSRLCSLSFARSECVMFKARCALHLVYILHRASICVLCAWADATLTLHGGMMAWMGSLS